MQKLKMRDWLLSLTAALGVASSTYAQENDYVRQAEAILNASEPGLVSRISHECGPMDCDIACDIACDGGCDAVGGPSYWFGGDGWDLGDSLFGADSAYDIGGWFQFGYHSANDGVFNTHPHHLDLQQMYLYAEKVADGSNGLGFGGRIDVLYGTDGPNTQSFGNTPGRFDFSDSFTHGEYGWAIPQLYVETAYENLSIKSGHFYTLLGYQVVPATGNFFYSIPYTFNYSEAFTHTGSLATYQASDNLTLYGGWTLGWDTGFDQRRGGSSFLGGASVGVTDDVTVTYILTAGNLGWIGRGYTHSIVADWAINDRWNYVFQSDLVSVSGGDNGNYDTIGVNQYLFYTVSDTVKVGSRMEWWKADGISLYEMAYGVNIRPMANVILRPEVRYNWAPGDNVPDVVTEAPGVYTNQFIFGMDAIFTF